jgi:hypothetical protein
MGRTLKFAFAATVLTAGTACGLISLATFSNAGSPAQPQIAPSQAMPAAAESRNVEPGPIPTNPAFAPAPVQGSVQQESDAFQNWSPSVAVLPGDLGEMGPSLKLGLDDVRNKDMAFCFRDLERQGDDAGVARTSTRATDFLLYLEVRDGVVDVVDAKVARPGMLPPSVQECCRDVLRGLEVKTFFTVPGERFTYIYEVEA